MSLKPKPQLDGECLITSQLLRRAGSGPTQAEISEALREVSAEIPSGVTAMKNKLIDVTLRLCLAGSAGMTLVYVDDAGEQRLRISPISGALERFAGLEVSSECPCGIVVRRRAELELFHNPQLYFKQLAPLNPPIHEVLCTRIVSEQQTVGTLWAMQHEEEKQFSFEQSEAIQSLARFAGAALPIAAKYGD